MKNNFIGTWKLKYHGYQLDGVDFVTSDYLDGRITYTDDMKMNVLIVTSKDPNSIKEVIAYSGSYSFDNSQVSHHIEVSLYSSRNSTVEERTYSFVDNTLVLRASSDSGRKYKIIWSKV